MDGVIFEKFIGSIKNIKTKNFEDLFKIYQQILLITSGDFNKTISLLTDLDKKYNITSSEYGIGNFIEDLKKKGYIIENKSEGEIKITKKSEIEFRRSALDEIFGKLKKGNIGNHSTNFSGPSIELDYSTKPYEYGDNLENIAFNESIKNAQINHGIDNFIMNENDL